MKRGSVTLRSVYPSLWEANDPVKLVTKLLSIFVVVAILAGCTNNAGDSRNSQNGPKVQSNRQAPTELDAANRTVPIRNMQNTAYVSLGDITKALGFNGNWLPDGSYGVGDYDPIWKFRPDESSAVKDEQTTQLPEPTVQDGKQLYISVSALQQLFGDVAAPTIESDRVTFAPQAPPEQAGAAGEEADFADDPSGPAELSPDGQSGELTDIPDATNEQPGNFTAQGTNTASVIAYARKYLGVKYKFGAGPYGSTGRFDCSTYIQHVFGHFGKSMPRTARAQATRGRTVSRSNLRRGDLLFFYVPGRFKSNRTVGHVGIYMGGGNMIHSCPQPKNGVQITSINKPYWKRTFLHAKRNF